MHDLIAYILTNKEWIFSGVGILILGWIINLLFSKPKDNSKITFEQNSGSNSTNIQGYKVTIKDDEYHV